MTTAARSQRAYPAARPSPLAVFIARAEARAQLYAAGEPVDVLQATAVASGLVAELGQDEVQQIISEAFRKVREAPR